MQTATFSIEFSFNNIMHRQIDGSAIGSLLGPSLANIFIRYYEALLFKRVNKPLIYYPYVDDSFASFMILLVICSKSSLQNELSNIRTILINSSYPEAVINTIITKKINQFCRPMQLDPKKCSVYFYLPWLGNVLMRYEMQLKTAIKCCYFAVKPCNVYTTRQLLPAAKKLVLLAFHQSNIVYQFLCHCNSRYVGCTSQWLH